MYRAGTSTLDDVIIFFEICTGIDILPVWSNLQRMLTQVK